MKEGDYMWFLSTVPQVLGTMIGVLAVFVVYALDSIQRSIEWNRDDLVRIVKPLGLTLDSFGLDGQLEQVKARIDHLRANAPYEPRLPDLEYSWTVIVQRRARRSSVTRDYIWLMCYYLVVIGAALMALPFGGRLAQYPMAGTVVISIFLIAIIGALVGVAIFLFDALRRLTI
jgi:hypothetical protein